MNSVAWQALLDAPHERQWRARAKLIVDHYELIRGTNDKGKTWTNKCARPANTGDQR